MSEIKHLKRVYPVGDFYAYRAIRNTDSTLFSRRLSEASQHGWEVLESGHIYCSGDLLHWAHLRRADVYKRKNAKDQRVADRRQNAKDWSEMNERRKDDNRKMRPRKAMSDVGNKPSSLFGGENPATPKRRNP